MGKVVNNGKGKRKQEDSLKTGSRKRKTTGVLQFFDVAAAEAGNESDSSTNSSFILNDIVEDEFDTHVQVKSDPGKDSHLPFWREEEEQMSVEELQKMLVERYKPDSGLVTYAEDKYETEQFVGKRTILPSSKKLIMPTSNDPIIWKVKCMVGRERVSAFCLMQKYVDLQSLGKNLQIISAFTLEHVKGYLYVEAYKQCDVYEACKGLSSIYMSQVAHVPQNEVSRLLHVRSKSSDIAVGTWIRVKKGKYKGDLAQVVAVNDSRKKATLKLIPRIDLQAFAEKIVGGVTAKKTATPAPRLISSSELEDFRPLITYRRDRDTDKIFEILNGMMLKDGYLYKKVPMDSLSSCGVEPSEDEILKFECSENENCNELEWLSQLYGKQDKNKILTVRSDKWGESGEGSSITSAEKEFKVHDMVFFSQKGFGVIISTENDDCCKVLTGGSKGPVVLNLNLSELKKASFDKKFIAFDHHQKTISKNDTVRVFEGPLQGRRGIVKQIYGGTVFIYDENEHEYGGYFCCKAQNCEKVKISGEPLALGFGDISASPKSPLSPKKSSQERVNKSNFNLGSKGAKFTVGQSLRIRKGPLKGYLCHVMAFWHSDVMVKLDSQQKILTVKAEHLTKVCAQSSAISESDNLESVKPFKPAGTQDCSIGSMDSAGTSRQNVGWSAGGLFTQSGDQPGSRKEAWDNWEANFTSPKPHDTCRGGAPSWSKHNNANKPWDKGQSVNPTSSMSKPNVKNQVNSWGNDKAEFFQYGGLERPKTFEGGRGLGWRARRGGSRGGRDQFGRGRGGGGDQSGRGRGGSRGGGDQFGRERGRAGRGGRDQSGRGRGGGRGDGDQVGRGRGGGHGGGDQLGRGRGSGSGGGRGGGDQLGRGRGGGRGGEDQFGRGKDCGRGGEGRFGRGRGGEGRFGRGRGGEAQFGRGRGGGRGGGDQFGRGRGSGRGQTSGFGRGGQQNYVKSDGSKDAQASGWKYTAGVTQDQAGKRGGPKKDGENAAGRGDRGLRGFGGSGGRMGRGGRGGGRDQFGRGRSFDRGQSPGWTYGGTPMRNPSGWSGDQTAGGWGSNKTFNAVKKDDGEASSRKRAAEIMGGQSESWGNKRRDAKAATNRAWQ